MCSPGGYKCQIWYKAKFKHTKSISGLKPNNFGPETPGLSKFKIAPFRRKWPPPEYHKCSNFLNKSHKVSYNSSFCSILAPRVRRRLCCTIQGQGHTKRRFQGQIWHKNVNKSVDATTSPPLMPVTHTIK